jgi:hypothetical protein
VTPRAAFAALGFTLTDQPREDRRDAFGRPIVTRWCSISPAACSRIGATGEGPDDATAEARLDNDLRATLRGLLAYAEADALAAVASPRRGHAGAAAAASWRNRVRAIVGEL